MTVWAVAGPAGAGKSTLGAALARREHAVLLDLDTITNPLLDAVAPAWHPDGHWNEVAARDVVRPARYATLRAAARAQVEIGLDVVLVAPFTAELRGGSEWGDLARAVGPELPRVVWLTAPARVLAGRIARRGEARDATARAEDPTPPRVPHLPLDATLPTIEQLARLAGPIS